MAALTLAQADRIADAALGAGGDHGFAPLCVVVLDTGGHPLVVKRDERSSIGRVEIADRQGRTAVWRSASAVASSLGEPTPFRSSSSRCRRCFRRGSCPCRAVCSSATAKAPLLGAVGSQR